MPLDAHSSTAPDMPLAADAREALGFLAAVGTCHHLTAIPPDGGRAEGLRVELPHDEERAAAWITRHNAEGMGIYWSANEVRSGFGGAKAGKNDLATLRAVFLDLDCDKTEGATQVEMEAAMMARLRSFAVAPSLLLHSGGGFVPVWLLDTPAPADGDHGPNTAAMEALGAEMRARLGGDPVQNVDRVLRLPDTVNWPNAGKRQRGRVPVLARRLDKLGDGGLALTGACVSLDALRRAIQGMPMLPPEDRATRLRAAAPPPGGTSPLALGNRPQAFSGAPSEGSVPHPVSWTRGCTMRRA
jgi:hypothetical protein